MKKLTQFNKIIILKITDKQLQEIETFKKTFHMTRSASIRYLIDYALKKIEKEEKDM